MAQPPFRRRVAGHRAGDPDRRGTAGFHAAVGGFLFTPEVGRLHGVEMWPRSQGVGAYAPAGRKRSRRAPPQPVAGRGLHVRGGLRGDRPDCTFRL
jgi:hypothetical protein